MNELLVAALGLAMLDEPRRTQPPNQLAPSHGNIITQRQVCHGGRGRGHFDKLGVTGSPENPADLTSSGYVFLPRVLPALASDE